MAYVGDYIKESINEGEFLRNVIYISGCRHMCKSCFSPQTWDFNYGIPFTTKVQEKVIKDIEENLLVKGLTICGGDSFFSAKDMIEFVKLYRKRLPKHTIWVYTGFTFEEIVNSENEDMIEYLGLVDVIIDGKFIEAKKDLSLKFRGSSNQRLIDVQQSLQQGEVILYEC